MGTIVAVPRGMSLLRVAHFALLASMAFAAVPDAAMAQSKQLTAYRPPSPTAPIAMLYTEEASTPSNGQSFSVPLFPEDLHEELPAVWPATLAGRYTVNNQPFYCTATVVGSETLLTAAHCVSKSDPRILVGGSKQPAKCVAYSQYSETWDEGCRSGQSCPTSADYALCHIEGANFSRYERLNIKPNAIVAGSMVKLVGYGCTTKQATEGSTLQKNILTGGWAWIDKVATPVNNYFLSTWDNKLVKKAAPIEVHGGVNVCPGDSGGAIYLSAKSSSSQRSIVAIASRVDGVIAQDAAGHGYLTEVTGPSYLSSTSSTDALAFFKLWTEKLHPGTDLCGYSPNSGGPCPKE